jgi:hypothetical protein
VVSVSVVVSVAESLDSPLSPVSESDVEPRVSVPLLSPPVSPMGGSEEHPVRSMISEFNEIDQRQDRMVTTLLQPDRTVH